jgi:hypothetical protein
MIPPEMALPRIAKTARAQRSPRAAAEGRACSRSALAWG